MLLAFCINLIAHRVRSYNRTGFALVVRFFDDCKIVE
jgi:hypothetical protein